PVNSQTGTSYTLQASDAGKLVALNNASAITLTVPETLDPGFSCILYQQGAGAFTVTAGGNTVLENISSAATSAGQYAQVTLFVRANSDGTHAIAVISGNLV